MIRKALPSDCVNLAALPLQVWLHTYTVQGIRSSLSPEKRVKALFW